MQFPLLNQITLTDACPMTSWSQETSSWFTHIESKVRDITIRTDTDGVVTNEITFDFLPKRIHDDFSTRWHKKFASSKSHKSSMPAAALDANQLSKSVR
jgi:hypothetical protein